MWGKRGICLKYAGESPTNAGKTGKSWAPETSSMLPRLSLSLSFTAASPFLEASFLHKVEKVAIGAPAALTEREGLSVLRYHVKICARTVIGSTSARCLPPSQSARPTGPGSQDRDTLTHQSQPREGEIVDICYEDTFCLDVA